jgi:hypothetical protein
VLRGNVPARLNSQYIDDVATISKHILSKIIKISGAITTACSNPIQVAKSKLRNKIHHVSQFPCRFRLPQRSSANRCRQNIPFSPVEP